VGAGTVFVCFGTCTLPPAPVAAFAILAGLHAGPLLAAGSADQHLRTFRRWPRPRKLMNGLGCRDTAVSSSSRPVAAGGIPMPQIVLPVLFPRCALPCPTGGITQDTVRSLPSSCPMCCARVVRGSAPAMPAGRGVNWGRDRGHSRPKAGGPRGEQRAGGLVFMDEKRVDGGQCKRPGSIDFPTA